MAQEYIRQYNSFRGVDFTSDPVDVPDYRLQYAVNMWRDYENGNGNMIETIPGFRKIFDEIPNKDGDSNAKMNGLHYYRTTDADGNLIDYLIIHFGRNLHSYNTKTKTTSLIRLRSLYAEASVVTYIENQTSKSVLSNNKLWIIDGKHMFSVEPFAKEGSDEELKCLLVSNETIDVNNTRISGTPYIPILFSDGEEYEDINLFSPRGYERYNNPSVKLEKDENGHDVAKYRLFAINAISEVLLDGQEILRDKGPIGFEYSEDEKVLIIKAFDDENNQIDLKESDLIQKELKMLGSIGSFSFQKGNKYPTFNDAHPSINARNAILKCTSIAVFDGKIFLTGNPELPNIVFFSSTNGQTGVNDPSYFGAHNWLNTGVGMTANRDITASQGVLMVFKGDTVQDGSIYYLTPFDVTEEEIRNIVPRFYLPTEGAAGIGCIGGAINFMDDTVFISKRGLDAVGKQLTNLERSIVHRSSNVDRKLLAEDLKNVRMVEWKGYLVVSVGGHMYLADSRAMYTDSTGNMQYEWFYLEGIGGYGIPSNPYTSAYKKQYRYWSGNLPEGEEYKGYSVKPNNNEEIVDEALITHDDLGIYFSKETDEDGNPANYLCYVDDEYLVEEGAKFYPAIELCVINDVLYFGTENGNIYCFNTDKRGEIPESIYKDGVWLDSNYDSKEDFVGWIPQEYYSFDGLKYPSGVITKTDNAGIPYATKNTINRSLVLRCGADPRTHSSIMVEVLTDRNSVFKEVDRKETSEQTFGMQDFSASTFDTYPFAFITFREHERKWIEKKYKIYNDAFRGILRLHSLSYRYEIGGNIK